MTEDEVEAMFQGFEDSQGNINYEGKLVSESRMFFCSSWWELLVSHVISYLDFSLVIYISL